MKASTKLSLDVLLTRVGIFLLPLQVGVSLNLIIAQCTLKVALEVMLN